MLGRSGIYIGNLKNDKMKGKGFLRNLFYNCYLEGEFENDELINGEKGLGILLFIKEIFIKMVYMKDFINILII